MILEIIQTVFVGPVDPVVIGFVTSQEVREYLNACLVALNAILLTMIGRQLLAIFAIEGWKWRQQPGAVFTACLWWIFLTDFVRACLAWYLLHAQNNGRGLTFLHPTVTVAYIVAGTVATIATLRLVYAVSPVSWGHRGWLSALGVTIGTVFYLSIWLD